MGMKEIYQKIANDNDVSLEEVEREIRDAVASTVLDEPIPSVEEFIQQVLLEVEREKDIRN